MYTHKGKLLTPKGIRPLELWLPSLHYPQQLPLLILRFFRPRCRAPTHDMNKYVCVWRENLCTQPPPAKQLEKSQASIHHIYNRYSMSPTLGFNYSSKNKQEYIYTKRNKNTYIQRERKTQTFKITLIFTYLIKIGLTLK